MTNSNFSAMLVKYQAARKLNNTKFISDFIEAHPASDKAEMPSKATPEIAEFAATFIAKKAKCTDPEFKVKMAEFAANATVVAKTSNPKKTVDVNGEY